MGRLGTISARSGRWVAILSLLVVSAAAVSSASSATQRATGNRVSAAEAPASKWSYSLEAAIRANAHAPGYRVTNVVVRPYHPFVIGGRVRIELYQAWIAYTHRGQFYVEYQVIMPDGEIMDEAYVHSVGDTGGLVG